MPDRARKLRVLLADDHVTVRHGLKLLIDSQSDMEVIAESSDGQGAVQTALEAKPDVIVMDISMPGMNGLAATRTLKQQQPDIAVVTLSDIGHREASDVALQIGRQWKLGGAGPAGDSSKNLGVVLLLVPLKNHRPGTGQVYIATGRGAEGFLNDAKVGRIRDSMIPALRNEDYSAALEKGSGLLAQAFAAEFHATLTTTPPPAP